jgi:hypothetical protein
MNKSQTLFEQVIITAQRVRELRQIRYGSLETGTFSPANNIKLKRTVDQAEQDLENGLLGREYLNRAINRDKDRQRTRRRT